MALRSRGGHGVGVVLGPHLEPSRRQLVILGELDDQDTGEVPPALGGAAAQQGAKLLLKGGNEPLEPLEEDSIALPSLLEDEGEEAEDEMFKPAQETVVFDADQDLDIPDFLKS